MKLAQIELSLFAPDKLIDVDAVQGHPYCQTIGLRDAEYMVGRDDRARTGHVLRNDFGLTGNIFAHVSGKQPRPSVVKSARR